MLFPVKFTWIHLLESCSSSPAYAFALFYRIIFLRIQWNWCLYAADGVVAVIFGGGNCIQTRQKRNDRSGERDGINIEIDLSMTSILLQCQNNVRFKVQWQKCDQILKLNQKYIHTEIIVVWFGLCCCCRFITCCLEQMSTNTNRSLLRHLMWPNIYNSLLDAARKMCIWNVFKCNSSYFLNAVDRTSPISHRTFPDRHQPSRLSCVPFLFRRSLLTTFIETFKPILIINHRNIEMNPSSGRFIYTQQQQPQQQQYNYDIQNKLMNYWLRIRKN